MDILGITDGPTKAFQEITHPFCERDRPVFEDQIVSDFPFTFIVSNFEFRISSLNFSGCLGPRLA